MRIAVLHNSGPGGASRFVGATAARLGREHDVMVVTWGDEPDPPFDVEQRWMPARQVHLRAPLHPFANLYRSVAGSRRAAGWANATQFDAVIWHPCQWGQAPDGMRLCRLPFIYYAHEGRRRSTETKYRTSDQRYAGGWAGIGSAGKVLYDTIGSTLDRRSIRSARRIYTNSEFTATNLQRAYGVRAGVIEPGIDTSTFHPTSSVARRGLLTVGALDRSKGADLIVEALALVPAERREPLTIVFNRFDPRFRARLSDRARAAGVELILRERIDDFELASAYCEARALVCAAQAEPFGLTIPEAAACGTPALAVSEGGYLATVDKHSGVLCPRTVEGLAAVIDRLLSGELQFDHDAIGAGAKTRWSWDACSAALADACAREAELR